MIKYTILARACVYAHECMREETRNGSYACTRISPERKVKDGSNKDDEAVHWAPCLTNDLESREQTRSIQYIFNDIIFAYLCVYVRSDDCRAESTWSSRQKNANKSRRTYGGSRTLFLLSD
jgi:hypothetical protein